MSWRFWRRRVNPLDAHGLRPLEAATLTGDLRAAVTEVKRAREVHGDHKSVRYLESLLYFRSGSADASELRSHLAPALEPEEGTHFPEPQLLDAELLASLGDVDGAAARLTDLAAEKKLPPALEQRIQRALQAVTRLRGEEGLRRVGEQAEALATALAPSDLVVRWRLSDLARLDSLLDDQPELSTEDRTRWTSLIGEIVVRAADGRWRLAPRPEDRAVILDEDRVWPVGAVLRDRLASGRPLFAAIHEFLETPTHEIPGVPGVKVVVPPHVHPAVVTDHVARALLAAGVTGLGVFRERPTPEGPVRLPVSFLDKGGILRALYVETRPWDGTRLAELRRWVWRVRTSAARSAAISLLTAFGAPREATDILKAPSDAPPIPGLPHDPRAAGARAATPRSLDEPKLRWLDEKAEVMESLVRSALGADKPTDLDIVRRVQENILNNLSMPPADLSPKQWNALYGYGSLYARVLARTVGARWTALGDDTQPGKWEMALGSGSSVRPIGAVLKLAQLGTEEGDLVGQYIGLRAADRTQD